MLDGVERAGSLQRRHSGLGVKGERDTAGTAEGLEGPLSSTLVASWKGSGRLSSPKTFQTIATNRPDGAALRSWSGPWSR